MFTSFAMLTAGRIPITLSFTPADALASLCAGEDALLATVHGVAPERLQPWMASLPWAPPTQETYSQRDGAPVLDVLRWHATPPVGTCPGSAFVIPPPPS